MTYFWNYISSVHLLFTPSPIIYNLENVFFPQFYMGVQNWKAKGGSHDLQGWKPGFSVEGWFRFSLEALQKQKGQDVCQKG